MGGGGSGTKVAPKVNGVEEDEDGRIKPEGGGGRASPLIKDGGGGGGGGGGRGKDSPPDRGGGGNPPEDASDGPLPSFLAIPTIDGNVGGGGKADFLLGLPPLLLLEDSPAFTAGGIIPVPSPTTRPASRELFFFVF